MLPEEICKTCSVVYLPRGMYDQMSVKEVWMSTSAHVLCPNVSDAKLQVTETHLEMNL